MPVLNDSPNPLDATDLQWLSNSSTAANDAALNVSALNPVETYLVSLAPGSRRAMAHALAIIAEVIQPGAFSSELDWSCVGYAEVARVRSALATKYAPATANKVLAALRGTLKAAFRMGIVDADKLARALDFRPVRGTRNTKGRCLDADELARLIGACDRSTPLASRNACLVALAFGCGLRRAELVGIELADIRDDGATLIVRGKGNKRRTAYLPDWAQTLLCEWQRHRGIADGPLFCPMRRTGSSPHRLTEQTIYDVLRALAYKAGVAAISPHDLRRTFVSSLLDQGVSLSTVSAMAGHADVSTTARYDRRGERAKLEASKHIHLDVLAPPSQMIRSGSALEARS